MTWEPARLLNFKRAHVTNYKNQHPNYKYTDKYSTIDLLQLGEMLEKKPADILRCTIENIKETDHAFVVKTCTILKKKEFKFTECSTKKRFIELCTGADYDGEHGMICGIKHNNTERIIVVNRGEHHKNVIHISVNNKIDETDIDTYVANNVPDDAKLSVLYEKKPI